MAKFSYTAQDRDGNTVNGVIDALTVSTARRNLIAKQLAPLDVQERKSILAFESTKKKVGRRELMHFSRQMSVFLRAGIPVLEALDVMSEDTSSKVLQRVVAEMGDSLR